MSADDRRSEAALRALEAAEAALRAARELMAVDGIARAAETATVWLDADEVAARYPVSRRCFLEHHRAGRIETSKVGGKVVATDKAVQAWLASSRRHRRTESAPTNVRELLDRHAARLHVARGPANR
jgi:hypothetical protein